MGKILESGNCESALGGRPEPESGGTSRRPRGLQERNTAVFECMKDAQTSPQNPSGDTRAAAADLPPQHLTLPEILRWRAKQHPQAPAATFLLDGELQTASLTFAELDRRARVIAAALLEKGGPGQRVFLLLDPSLDYVAAVYGCMYARAIAVPAYPPDPFRLSRLLPRLQAMTVDSGANALLANEALLETSHGLLRSLDVPHCIGIESLDGDPLEEDWPAPSFDELGLLQYTSGSTGMPRGVMVTHANLLHNCRAMHARMYVPEAISITWLPPYHDMGLIGGLLLPMHSGRPATLMSPLHFMQRPVRWLQAITRHRATTIGSPNFGLEHCVRKVDDADLETLDLSSVQVCVTGAERVRAETLDRFLEKFGPCGFHREAMMPAFGLAEATLMVSAAPRQQGPRVRRFNKQDLTRKTVRPDDDGVQLVSCGVPAKDVRIAIVDPDTREPLAPGRIGEIWVHSPGNGVGYWNRSEESEQVFHARLSAEPNGHVFGQGPFPTSRWEYLRTGDLGFFEGDELYVAGRCKELVILSGRNFFPQDIEACVSAVHPGLKLDGGAAFSVDTEQGEELVVVQEVLRPRRLDLPQLAEQTVKSIIEQFDVRPHAIVLIAAGALPKTSSGKTRRQAAKELFLSDSLHELLRWPQAAVDGGSNDTSAQPLSADEAKLAALWSDVLEVNVNDPNADFLSLGGHSLEIAHLLFVLEREYQVALTPRLILEHSVLRDMAVALAAARDSREGDATTHGDRQPWLQFEAGDRSQVSYAEQRFWLLDQLGGGGSLSHLSMQWTLQGSLDPQQLQAAVENLMRRHPALRTRLAAAGEPRAEVLDAIAPPVTWLDWSRDATLDPAISDVEHRWTQLSSEYRDAPLPLEQAPLWRLLAVRLDEGRVRLQWTVHHAICDGASLQLLINELAALLNGEPLQTPASDLRTFAAWQRSPETFERFQQRLAYWRDRLGDAPRTVDFPATPPRATSSPPMD